MYHHHHHLYHHHKAGSTKLGRESGIGTVASLHISPFIPPDIGHHHHCHHHCPRHCHRHHHCCNLYHSLNHHHHHRRRSRHHHHHHHHPGHHHHGVWNKYQQTKYSLVACLGNFVREMIIMVVAVLTWKSHNARAIWGTKGVGNNSCLLHKRSLFMFLTFLFFNESHGQIICKFHILVCSCPRALLLEFYHFFFNLPTIKILDKSCFWIWWVGVWHVHFGCCFWEKNWWWKLMENARMKLCGPH